jgi:hypothetical protein
MNQQLNLITQEKIEQRILLIRGKKVMLDRDLASLYEIETKVFNQAVKRNIKRFPEDFMFHLNWEEARFSRSQNVTLKGKNIKYLPYAFTEHGILMLSSVLNSDKAIEVNIQIMRTFTKLRELMLVHKDLRIKIEELEKKYDSQFKIVFNALRKLIDPPPKPKTPIGLVIPTKRSDPSASSRTIAPSEFF